MRVGSEGLRLLQSPCNVRGYPLSYCSALRRLQNKKGKKGTTGVPGIQSIASGTLAGIVGSFPKQGDPKIDPKIL